MTFLANAYKNKQTEKPDEQKEKKKTRKTKKPIEEEEDESGDNEEDDNEEDDNEDDKDDVKVEGKKQTNSEYDDTNDAEIFKKDIIIKRKYSNLYHQNIFNIETLETIPINLNSLIIVGTCLANYNFILAEHEISDNSWNLTNHPNFQRLDSDLKDIFIANRALYCDTKEVINILQKKFCKYIYMAFLKDTSNSVEYYKPLFIPKDGIHPYYNYVILPSYASGLDEFYDSFEYCYKTTSLQKSNDGFIKNFTMKYMLKWIILIKSKTDYETSIPQPNSILFYRFPKNKYKYLKYSNRAISVVSINDIFLDEYQPLYFCYEKIGKANK